MYRLSLYNNQKGQIHFLFLVGFLGVVLFLYSIFFLSNTTYAAECTLSLQSKIDAAAAGSTVTADPCVYRETITINKPLTLVGQIGSEIRGSTVWSNWTQVGSTWVSSQTVPSFQSHGECRPNTTRCLWPEQVFVDGTPLLQVAANPTGNQFSIDANRKVILGTTPVGKTVEVTTRTKWVYVGSDNVTIKNFVMKHSAIDSQNGAIMNTNSSKTPFNNLTVEGNKLSYAHGQLVTIYKGSNHKIINNELSYAGQVGGGGSENTGTLLQGNKIHHNNVEDFEPGWEAGGIKFANNVVNLTMDSNEVFNNGGPGLWCDINCQNTTFSNNRVHDNEQDGIFFEISNGAKIFNNSVWANGSGRTNTWCYGAGILISSSRNAEVYNNTVAWNNHNLSVISQRRNESFNPSDIVDGIYIHDNKVMGFNGANTGQGGLNWCQDWAGVMFNSASNNRGVTNRFWYLEADGSYNRFGWNNTGFSKIADFATTAGGQLSSYLSSAEKDSALTTACMPATPGGAIPACATPSPSASTKLGDIDKNNKVDIFDYNILLTNFGKNGPTIPGDLNNNGKVDIFDYNILLTNFGK